MSSSSEKSEPCYIFRGWRAFEDPLVGQTIKEMGGFHDAWMDYGRVQDGVFRLVFRDPYFWEERSSNLYGVCGGVFDLITLEDGKFIDCADSHIFRIEFDHERCVFRLILNGVWENDEFDALDVSTKIDAGTSRFRWIYGYDKDQFEKE